ncbi:MAG: MliC family protein [Minisyncoccia bacterium]
MTKSAKIIISILVILLVVISGLSFFSKNGEKDSSNRIIGGDRDIHGCIGSAGYSYCEAKASCIRVWESYCTPATPKTVTFQCDSSKSIIATFYPTDDKFVDLKLSDERNMSVPHAVSASGARYAKADESFVFWNKGDTAFITEGTSSTETYSNCVGE